MLWTAISRIGLAGAVLGAWIQPAYAQTRLPVSDAAATPVAYYAPQPNWNYHAPAAYGASNQMAAAPAPATIRPMASPNGQGYYGYRMANAQPGQMSAAASQAAPVTPAGPMPANGGGYAYGGEYTNGGGCVTGGGYGPGCQSCGGPGCGAYGPCGHGLFGGYFHSPCGMVQHYPYYPPMHGYYYLHPYHYTHVPAHQAFMARAGVDPRNPYSNDLFKTLYAEYRAGERGRTLDRPPPPESTPQLPTWPR
jgi:hypothetical protein